MLEILLMALYECRVVVLNNFVKSERLLLNNLTFLLDITARHYDVCQVIFVKYLPCCTSSYLMSTMTMCNFSLYSVSSDRVFPEVNAAMMIFN